MINNAITPKSFNVFGAKKINNFMEIFLVFNDFVFLAFPSAHMLQNLMEYSPGMRRYNL